MSSPTMQTSAFFAFVLYICKLAQVCGDRGELVVGVDSERDTDFAGGDHVDGALVLVEDGEDLAEVAVGHEHAAGDHVDDAQFLFYRDGLEGALAMGREGDDARAFVGCIATVEDQDGDVLFDGRKDCGRVQDLGAEVGASSAASSKLMTLTRSAIGADAGICGHDAIDVGPDFDGPLPRVRRRRGHR